jgi:hypothetical protein
VEAAHWNQTAADWHRLISLCGPCAIGLEIEGNIVSSATLLPHGSQAAWLGMVLTHPEHRRSGYARALLGELLERAPPGRSIFLDATSQGLPLYRQLGFVEEGVVRRWLGEVRTHTAATSAVGAWNARLDAEATGMDRSALLRELAAEGATLQDADGGFAMRRAGRLHPYVGPLVARGTAAAARLLHAAAAGHGPVFWDILDSNRPAVELAASLGFTPHRRLVRMRRGKAVEAHPELQFAIAGFEYG